MPSSQADNIPERPQGDAGARLKILLNNHACSTADHILQQQIFLVLSSIVISIQMSTVQAEVGSRRARPCRALQVAAGLTTNVSIVLLDLDCSMQQYKFNSEYKNDTR